MEESFIEYSCVSAVFNKSFTPFEPRRYFPYLFYVDFEAFMADKRAQNALGHLKEFAMFLRVLGSYPTDNGLP
ncbi:arogenate dehydratase 1 [Perilla frutescens var. hirtella]|nr:arogenate dehydratase 1 [Perilla frutescens var. hirtella]